MDPVAGPFPELLTMGWEAWGSGVLFPPQSGGRNCSHIRFLRGYSRLKDRNVFPQWGNT